MKKCPSGWYLHPYEIAICGFKNAGKTTLIQKLIVELRARGLTVGCLKSDAHGFSMDHPGTDTFLMREAGAGATGIVDRDRSGWLLANPKPPRADQVLVEQAFNTTDVLLIEGRKDSPLPKILLWDDRGEMNVHLAATNADISAISAIAGHPQVESEARAWADKLALPYLDRDDTRAITAHILHLWELRAPRLRALILAGGASSRMGEDKSLMSYGARLPEPQRLAALLQPLCASVHLSCRADQTIPGFDNEATADGVPLILRDAYLNMGPLGGMLTAFDADPLAAWFVVSCDLPLLEARDLAHVAESRNPFALGTTPTTLWDGVEMPKPLCSIWEPKARPRLLGLLAGGVKCPRWALRAGGARYITPPNREALLNANRPEDRRRALEILQRRNPS